MKEFYTSLMIWCLVNIPATFIFYNYHVGLFGSAIFFLGCFILLIFGVIISNKKDRKRMEDFADGNSN
jgi:hypothetical protein